MPGDIPFGRANDDRPSGRRWAIVMLGFFLRMRHATGPDHVIAITTIVSRQKTIRGAPADREWGGGHTLIIMEVGSVIIFFDVIISPRLGLAMELGSRKTSS
jgi:high-affinity nickel-transport protein